VQHYVRSRPSYPPEVIDILRRDCGLTPDSLVADIGSGTGLFTRLLLENGNRVWGVEPNENMRRAGEQYLAAYAKFVSLPGTAEATSLPNHCLALVTSAQAGHWFDRDKARAEFQRILKPGGYVALLWNERRMESPFERDYENLIAQYGLDYDEVQQRAKRVEGGGFFSASAFQLRTIPNHQDLDYPGLEGRLLSASYMPAEGHESFKSMLGELRRIFDIHERNGIVRLEYDTRVFFGKLFCFERSIRVE
jgi:SAM-dependent methyltransferase